MKGTGDGQEKSSSLFYPFERIVGKDIFKLILYA